MSERLQREVLNVADVMARYGLRDRRAARRLMDEAGAFVVGGRLVLRREDLVAHEEALRAARRPGDASRGLSSPRRPALDRERCDRAASRCARAGGGASRVTTGTRRSLRWRRGRSDGDW